MSTPAPAPFDQHVVAELAEIRQLLNKLVAAQKTGRQSMTISAWCRRHGYSRAFWYILKGQGRAPATTGTGHATRITEEADNAWQRARAIEAAAAAEVAAEAAADLDSS